MRPLLAAFLSFASVRQFDRVGGKADIARECDPSRPFEHQRQKNSAPRSGCFPRRSENATGLPIPPSLAGPVAAPGMPRKVSWDLLSRCPREWSYASGHCLCKRLLYGHLFTSPSARPFLTLSREMAPLPEVRAACLWGGSSDLWSKRRIPWAAIARCA